MKKNTKKELKEYEKKEKVEDKRKTLKLQN